MLMKEAGLIIWSVAVIMLAFTVSSAYAIENICTLGDLKCGEDGFTVSYCWDENQDGYLEWTVFDTYFCSQMCVDIIELQSGGTDRIEDVSDCFPSQPETRKDVCTDGETICGIDGKSILTCGDHNNDGSHNYEMIDDTYVSNCAYGCNYVFTPGAVQSKEAAECNPGPGYCPNQCSVGEEYCSSDGHSWTACVTNSDTNCPEFSEYFGYCEHGCIQGPNGITCADNIFDVSEDAPSTDPYTLIMLRFDDYDKAEASGDMDTLTDSGPNNHSFYYCQIPTVGHSCGDGNHDCGHYSIDSAYGRSLYFGPQGEWCSNSTIKLPVKGTIEFWSRHYDSYFLPNDEVIIFTMLNNTDDGMQVSFNGDLVRLYMFDNNTYEFYTENSPDVGWIHYLIHWDAIENVVRFFIDGENVLVDESPVFGSSFNSDYTVRVGINAYLNADVISIDEFKMSSVVYYPDSDCVDQCNSDNTAICSGILLDYSVVCTDSDNDGCLDYDSEPTYCSNLCDPTTGLCRTSDSRLSSCTSGEYTCHYSGSYEVPCGDVDSDGFNEWDHSQRVICDYGCNEETGRCNSPQDACSAEETFCCERIFDDNTLSDLTLNSICDCSDVNGDGYRDKGGNITEYCGVAGWCSDDNWVGNGSNYAWCEDVPTEMYVFQQIVDDYASYIDVAIPESGRTILAFFVCGIALIFFSVLGSRNGSRDGMKLGGVAFLCFMIMFIVTGWIPGIFALGLLAVSGFFLFSHFMSNGGNND